MPQKNISRLIILFIIAVMTVTCSDPGPAVPEAPNSCLASLTLSSGSLEPSFDPEVTSYTVWFDIGTTSVSFIPVVEKASSTLQWKTDGMGAFTEIESGNSTGSVPLAEGGNTFEFKVISAGLTETVYTVTVNRMYLKKWDASNLNWDDEGLVWY
ncbi:MAG: cadherin-like beta sandwich domain-containing protein [Spirochaetales bacterium]|nr:cadherin-like beta sandwich domain-containing protein [Spirochaetales bacterium]